MAKERSGISRRDFLKQGTAVGLGLALSPSLSGLSWAASKDRVTIYHSTSVDTLHPYNHSLGPVYGVWNEIMEPLVEVDYRRNQWVGRLAESWEFQGKKWVFHLRKGIRFHNGALFTSKDVVYSFNRIKTDKLSLQRRQLRDLAEMEAPDDHTVILITKKPKSIFLDRVRNRFIMSKAAADKYGADVDKHAIGTGPYKFVSFKRDGDLVLRRNEDYWRGKPEIEEFVWRKVAEPAARVAALEAGQADVVNNVPVHEIPRLDQHPRVRTEKVAGLRVYFLILNPAFKPWDNKLVRQAANYSVDADSIVKNIFDGNGFVLEGAAGSHVIGYDPNSKRYPYDPNKGKELLAKAGYPNGVDVKLYFSAGRYPQDKEVIQVIAAQMRKGGFRVELVSQEWVVFWGRSGVNGGKLPFYYIGRGSVIDADTHLNQYFKTGESKRTAYSNPEFDKLIDEEQATADHSRRVELLHKAAGIVMEDAPWIPMYNLADVYGVTRNVIWNPRPDEKVLASGMKIRS